jgi:hypothetical protein
VRPEVVAKTSAVTDTPAINEQHISEIPQTVNFKKVAGETEFLEMAKTQKITAEEKSIVYDESSGYIRTGNSKSINAQLRGLPDEAVPMKPGSEQTIEVMKMLTESNSLDDNYEGVRNVGTDFVKYVLGIDHGTYGTYEGMFDLPGFDYTKQDSAKNALKDIQNLIGKTFEEKGFMSVSMVEDLNIMQAKPVKLTVQMPKGLKGYVTENWDESEFVAAIGTKMKIVDAKIFHPKNLYKGDEKYYINIIAHLSN